MPLVGNLSTFQPGSPPLSDTIEQQFRDTAKGNAARTAVSDGETTLRYGEVLAAADRGAWQLSQAELKNDEPVVVPVSNIAADIPAFLAVWRAGGVVVPVHRAMPKAVVDALTNRLGNRFVLENDVETISREPPRGRALLNGAGTIIFTSGSTGEPKGVVLSGARAAAKLAMIQEMTGWRAGENALIGLQLTFSFGQWATWLTLLNGGCVRLLGRFDAAEVRDLLQAGKIQRFPAVPTMLRHLVEPGGIASFKGQIMSGGEPLPASLGQRVRAVYPAAGLGDIYGLTETGTSDFFVQPADYDGFAGTIGRPGDGIDWRIDPQNQELEIRSPWRMLGYLDAPDLTAQAMRDGWFRTGDLAEESPSGAVRLIGRANDLIIRSGNKISPLEVEAVFLRHEAVAAAMATGVADAGRGEAIHLAIVQRRGHEAVPDALKAWAGDYLERFKLPDVIHLVDELPSGSTGKADRRALRKLIESGLN